MPGKLRSALGLDSHTNGVRLPLDVECELDARNHASLFSVARKIDRYGSSSFIHAEKIELTQQLGVQLRDLRVLDPFLACSCPSAVLCRDKALVVNLEHINCIVTTDYVLMADDQDNTCLSFAKELQRRCAPQNRRTGCQELDDQLTGTATPFCNNPYELMVLDLVLDVVCSRLEHLASELEGDALFALDALTKKVSKHTLEHVRRVKNCMVRMNARAGALHDLLEKMLDSDSNMKDMNLTAKQQVSAYTTGQAMAPSSLQDCHADVQKVEMVLETYSMHIDSTYNKLQFLKEYIDDTEDYVNIELDGQRNQLIRIGLVLTTGTFAVGLINAVAGIFGMNLDNGHEVGQGDSRSIFLVVTLVAAAGALLIFAVIIAILRGKKLIRCEL